MKRDLRSLTLHAMGIFEGRAPMPQVLTCLTQLQSLACLGLGAGDVEAAGHVLYSLGTLRELELSWEEPVVIPDAITTLSNLTRLCITKFTGLPAALGTLSKLERLELASGFCASLPPSIMNLKRLKSLALSGGELVELPPELTNLPQFHQLRIEYCKSLVLPSTFWDAAGKEGSQPLSLELKQYNHELPETLSAVAGRLHSLTICFHQFFPPHGIGRLGSLRHLTLDYLITCVYLPPLGCLHQLQSLVICSCPVLRSLPLDLGSLKLLQKLTVESCNNLFELPEFTNTFPSLQRLRLMCLRNLEAIPKSIMQLVHARNIHIACCSNLADIPGELLSLHGLTATSRVFPEKKMLELALQS